jgi:hypothetical protein
MSATAATTFETGLSAESSCHAKAKRILAPNSDKAGLKGNKHGHLQIDARRANIHAAFPASFRRSPFDGRNDLWEPSFAGRWRWRDANRAA